MTCQNRVETASRWARSLIYTAAVAGVFLAGLTAQGGNILINPSFEANSGNNVAVGWTYFMPPTGSGANYWVDNAGNRAHSGGLYWKQWGVFWDPTRTNVAGIHQTFNSAPGSVYEANGWFYTLTTDQMGPDNVAWVDVSFLDATGTNLLGIFKTDDFATVVGTDQWFQFSVTNALDLAQPLSTGDPSFTSYAVTGAVSQLVAPPGTTFVRYRFAFTQAGSQGGAVYFDDAVLDQITGPLPPMISGLSPVNMIYYAPSNGITFTASSPSGTTISNSAIRVVVNGQDVSGELTISGTDSDKTVGYFNLQSNTVYNASIEITDVFGFTATANTYFETTWVGVPPIVFLWEAEDFDFGGGQYINNPELCSTNGNPNCYFGKVGVEGVDEFSTNSDGEHIYRPDDPMATTGSGDFLRKELVDAGRTDYKVGWFPGGEWVNYTRDWPTGTFWVMARLANGGGSGTLTFSRVSADGSTTDLGTFTLESGRGWTTYDSIFLRDTNGNIANVTFGGKQTYRATTAGNVDMGLFMLVAAQADLPAVSGLFPTGTRPFEATNTLSFNVTSQGGSISPENIRLLLNGQDVSGNLQITGTASDRQVTYPQLAPNTMYTSVLTVTNDSASGVAVTNQFDTFNESNLIIQAEDFDYDAGKFIDNPEPEAYLPLPDAVPEVDFHHVQTTGERYFYRGIGIPNEITSDYKLQAFVEGGNTDYNLGWFNDGEWANYTRIFPVGQYHVYGRFAGSGNFTVNLNRVVSGVGTTNQATERLGRFTATARDWQIWDWVPLTDTGSSEPAILSLSGTNTLRLTTTGNANVNYFMFVPIIGIPFSAERAGDNIALSFPTQPGTTYRVMYRNDLASGDWTLLTTVDGDGSEKTVTDPLSAANTRFYQLVSP